MADLVNERAPLAPAPPRRIPNAPRHRFGIAYLVLAATLGAAVGLAVLFAGGGKHSQGTWSAWKPTGQGVQKFAQISRFVASKYALASGSQLVGVLSAPPQVQAQGSPSPVRAIGVSSGLPGETLGDLRFYDSANAWTYSLCGLGNKCALADGRDTVARFDLLRREALELALYTFKYEPKVQTIVTYLPSASGAAIALFFSRGRVEQALKVPIARTLRRPNTRIVPGQMSPNEIGVVRSYTPALLYQFRQLPDGTLALVLQPARTG